MTYMPDDSEFELEAHKPFKYRTIALAIAALAAIVVIVVGTILWTPLGDTILKRAPGPLAGTWKIIPSQFSNDQLKDVVFSRGQMRIDGATKKATFEFPDNKTVFVTTDTQVYNFDISQTNVARTKGLYLLKVVTQGSDSKT